MLSFATLSRLRENGEKRSQGRELCGNFLDPLVVWSSLELLRAQQKPSNSDREHLPWLVSPIGADSFQKTCCPGGGVSQYALQREERFIHGLVQWTADRLVRLVQPMVDSFVSASSTESILLLFRSRCNGYWCSFCCSSTHTFRFLCIL